jgi:hypothetical protein
LKTAEPKRAVGQACKAGLLGFAIEDLRVIVTPSTAIDLTGIEIAIFSSVMGFARKAASTLWQKPRRLTYNR